MKRKIQTFVGSVLIYFLGYSLLLPQQITTFMTDDGPVNNIVFSIFEDNSNFIGVGTNKGLGRYDGKKWDRFTQANNPLINDKVNSILQDNKDYPIGQIDVEYTGEKNLECTIGVGMNKYGNEYKKNIVLPANPSLENVQPISVFPAFNDSILYEPDDIPLMTDIKIAYMSGNRPKEEVVSQPFTLLRRNRIDWQYGVEQAAAFITPEDPTVIQFNRNALIDDEMTAQNMIINDIMTKAIRLFDAVSSYGIRYEEDSFSPYCLAYRSIDNILYPAQLLNEKRGNCDNLTIFFASLLENRNIETALVSVPGHIFLLFNSGLQPGRSFQLCCAENLYFEYQNHLWIPLETTLVNQAFCAVWQAGARQLQKHAEDLEIINVREAWQVYKPIAEVGIFIKSFQTVPTQKFAQEVNRVQIIQKEHLHELEKKLSQSPDSIRLRNMLASTYANLNDFEKAEHHFQYLLTKDSTNALVLNNVGNLFMMKGNLDSAETYYWRALKYAEGEPQDGITLNLGLLYAAAGLDSEAVELFAQVMRDSNDFKRIGNLLGITIEEDDMVKATELKPQKRIDKITVKQLANKARKKKPPIQKPKPESKKTVGVKGTIPGNEMESVIYWAF